VLEVGAFVLEVGAFVLEVGAFVLEVGAFVLNLGAFVLNLGAFVLEEGALVLVDGTFVLDEGILFVLVAVSTVFRALTSRRPLYRIDSEGFNAFFLRTYFLTRVLILSPLPLPEFPVS